MRLDKQGPDGMELIAAAATQLETLRRREAECVEAFEASEAARTVAEERLRTARFEVAKADEVLRRLVAVGACTDENCGLHSGVALVDDPTVPIRWRVALMFLHNPGATYYEVATRLYPDPHLSKTTAKNRVNGHLTSLKHIGVVTLTHDSRYIVDRAKLIEASGLAIPEEPAMPTE